MMTSAQMKELKQVNVSVDTPKSKERFRNDFSSALSAEKKEMIRLSGQKRQSFYRVFREGTLNAKLALSIAQVLNVTPYYYTGAADEKAPLTDEITIAFLREHGYNHIASSITSANRKQNKPSLAREAAAASYADEYASEDVEDDDENDDIVVFTLEFPDSPRISEVVEELPLDEAVLLLEALYLRAKAGSDAATSLEAVKRCLLS